MIDIALNPISNDLVFEDFDFDLVEETNQIMQNLAIRLRFFLEEWYLDITQGLPYYQIFFTKAPNLIQVESILKNEILTTRGIVELISFVANFDSRTRIFSVNFTAKSINGEELQKEMELRV